MSLQLWAALALAIAGGVVAWLGGRRILRHTADPLFIDRMYAHRLTVVRIYMLMVIAIAVLAGVYTPLAFLIFYFAIGIGGFSSRKRLYDETWTLPQYLLNRVRVIVFAGGFWIALFFAPALVRDLGVRWSPIVFVALVVAFYFYHDLLLFGLDSEPLRDAALIASFEPILAKSDAPRPRLFEGGARTGRFANAIALPKGKRSRIVFTRALLRNLEPAEITAIFAHELAHIEHDARRRNLLRIIAGMFVLPLVAVGPEALILANHWDSAGLFPVAWPLILLFAMLGAMMRRQKNETAADLRALELGADPPALISGLEKLHRVNRVPRRFDAAREHNMSHPSVARRVEAIRRKAGLAEQPAPALPREFGDIRFTDDALHARGTAFRYDALRSLTLRKTLRGFALAGRGTGITFTIPVNSAAAAEMHEILNWVDGRLAPPASAHENAPREARLVAVLLLLMSVLPGISFPPLVMSIVALIVPTAPAVAALGATAIVAGAIAVVRPSQFLMIASTIQAFGAAEILLGIFCLVLLRRIAQSKRAAPTLITLGALLAIVAIPMAITFHPDNAALQLYVAARTWPSIAVLLIGIGAALAASGRKRASIAVVATAVAFLGCGTRTFAHISGGDPLLTDREPRWVKAPAPLATRTLEKTAMKLRLSPDGKQIAVQWSKGFDGDEEVESKSFGAGGMTGALRDMPAIDAAFAGDRLLSLAETDAGMDISDGVQWKVSLPALFNPELRVDGNRWRVSGMRPRNYTAVAYAGMIGSPAYAAESRNSGAVYATMIPAPIARKVPAAAMFTMGNGPTQFWCGSERVGRTVLAAYDVAPVPGSHDFAIVGHDVTSTYVAVIDGERKSIRALGEVPGHARRAAVGRSCIALIESTGDVIVWNLRSSKAMRIASGGTALDAAFSDRAVGVLRGNSVSIYSTGAID